jgi:hypothetical protein
VLVVGHPHEGRIPLPGPPEAEVVSQDQGADGEAVDEDVPGKGLGGHLAQTLVETQAEQAIDTEVPEGTALVAKTLDPRRGVVARQEFPG